MSNFPVPSDEPTCVMAWVQIPLEMLNAIVVLSPKLLISTIDNRHHTSYGKGRYRVGNGTYIFQNNKNEENAIKIQKLCSVI